MIRCLENQGTALPVELSYIPDELKKRAKSELFEDEDTRNNSLRLLKSMLKDESGLKWQDDDLFLLSFLRARKFDVKRAFNVVKLFYTKIGKHGELFHNFNYEDVSRTVKENSVGILPYRDSEGCTIIIIRASTWNPHINSLGDITRTLCCGLLHANLSPATHIAGFKVIVDFSGFSVKQLPHVSPNYLWLLAEAIQNCFPGRFRGIHVVNENYLFSYIWAILKKILIKKLRDRFHFHGKNVKKLHDYFSPSILSAEFQGELPPFDNTEWGRNMAQSADYLTYVFSHGYQKYKAKTQEKY